MSSNIATTAEDDRIVQLVSSGVRCLDDGSVEVYLVRDDDEAPTRETDLRLTEDDALELADALRHAVELVAGSEPQKLIRVEIIEPWPKDW